MPEPVQGVAPGHHFVTGSRAARIGCAGRPGCLPWAAMTLYEQLGGEAPLRAILTDFYRRVFADPMIGYLFTGHDPARLVELEFQLTAKMLGGPVEYTGRSIRAAHEKHPIRRGHFHRRNAILQETLAAHGAPAAVVEAWMGHARALERAVLSSAARADAACDRDVEPREAGVVVYR